MADEYKGPQEPREFDLQDGLALALSYLEDPSDVPCPQCGPGTIEVVCFLDAPSVETGSAVPTEPDGDYTVVLYCHNCGRAAALDLTRDQQQNLGGGFEDPVDEDVRDDEIGDEIADAFEDIADALDEEHDDAFEADGDERFGEPGADGPFGLGDDGDDPDEIDDAA